MKKIFALAAPAAVVTLPVAAQVRRRHHRCDGAGGIARYPVQNTFTVVPMIRAVSRFSIVMDDATDPATLSSSRAS
jgi:hypothetical protein